MNHCSVFCYVSGDIDNMPYESYVHVDDAETLGVWDETKAKADLATREAELIEQSETTVFEERYTLDTTNIQDVIDRIAAIAIPSRTNEEKDMIKIARALRPLRKTFRRKVILEQ